MIWGYHYFWKHPYAKVGLLKERNRRIRSFLSWSKKFRLSERLENLRYESCCARFDACYKDLWSECRLKWFKIWPLVLREVLIWASYVSHHVDIYGSPMYLSTKTTPLTTRLNLSESDFSSAPFGSFKEKGLKLRLPMTLWLWQLLFCFLETTLPETNLATENWFRENSLFQGLIGNCKVNTPCFSHTKFLSVYPSENKKNKFCQKKHPLRSTNIAGWKMDPEWRCKDVYNTYWKNGDSFQPAMLVLPKDSSCSAPLKAPIASSFQQMAPLEDGS